MFWWNGLPLPVPIEPIQYTYRDIEGTNSGQTIGGSYSKKVIARKEDVMLQWDGLTAEEAKVIAEIKKSTFGRLSYYSPMSGKFVTKTMYTEDLTENINSGSLELGRLSADMSAALQFRQG